MKLLIFILVFAILLGIGAAFYINTTSHKLYVEAVDYYEAGDYRSSYDKLNEAIDAYRYNRKAIYLKSKVYRLLNSYDKFKEGAGLLAAAEDALEEERYSDARKLFAESLESFLVVRSQSPHYEQAKENMDYVLQRIDVVDEKLTKEYLEKAGQFVYRSQYIRAYEYLGGAPKTRDIVEYRSLIAYNIGYSRYQEILKDGYTDIILNDAIYWFRMVDRSASVYSDAQYYVNELENLR